MPGRTKCSPNLRRQSVAESLLLRSDTLTDCTPTLPGVLKRFPDRVLRPQQTRVWTGANIRAAAVHRAIVTTPEWNPCLPAAQAVHEPRRTDHYRQVSTSKFGPIGILLHTGEHTRFRNRCFPWLSRSCSHPVGTTLSVFSTLHKRFFCWRLRHLPGDWRLFLCPGFHRFASFRACLCPTVCPIWEHCLQPY